MNNIEISHYPHEQETCKDLAIFLIYRLLERMLTFGLTGNIDIQGVENIPVKGPLAIALAPHTGVMEVPPTNIAYENQGLSPVWATKAETLEIKHIGTLLEQRHFPIHRHQVDRLALDRALEVLQRGGIVASALEGTRGEENQERTMVSLNDRMKLSPGYPGCVYFAYKGRAPIQPVTVWGPEDDRLFPFPEKYISEHGFKRLAFEIIKQMLSREEKPEISIRILPLYEDHLLDPYLGHKKITTGLQEHTHRIMFKIIEALPDNWPLGFYENQTIQSLMEAS